MSGTTYDFHFEGSLAQARAMVAVAAGAAIVVTAILTVRADMRDRASRGLALQA